ncbi:DAK2 domain-containing protein [Sporanaerobacter acetigenes]|uniref:DAK2 domain-containing protein n=1 Tax=Sporanaerobacter acetigenes TaxID=165813 RepID=UPI00331B7575
MKIQFVDGILLKKAFIGAANFLEQSKEEVNALNVFPVPDGDTGTNMSLTFQSAMKEILNLNEYSVEKVAMAASNGSLMGARGNSGVILSQLFRGLANGLKGKEKADAKELAKAFKLASDTAYKAVMKPTEGTILTVARECAEAAITLSKNEKDIVIFLDKVIQQGNIALNKTPDMLPVLKEAGVVDAGGKGLMVILAGAFKALTTNGEIKYETVASKKSEDTHFKKELSTGEIKFGYCTEFIVKNTKEDVENFKQELSKYGDSLLVVGGNDLIKVHVHTNNPGLVLEKGLSIGELHDIKIDNMRVQHRNLLVEEDCDCIDNKVINLNEKKEKKKYSFITVAMGDGIASVFKDLNVDFIIPGGQTMNPSTEDILNGIKEVEGEDIIILPNNGNIVLAAEQAQKMSERKVHVFPTKSIPEGISALLAFNAEVNVEENLDNMKSAVQNVKTGQVTYAVRNTEINGTKISKDDIIGICKGDIKSSGKDIQETSLELLKKMVDEDTELITIFYGNTIEEKEANKFGELAEKEFKDCDIEVIYGGQPIYYYIFSVE